MVASAALYRLGRRRWRAPRSPRWRLWRKDGGGSEAGRQPDRETRAGFDHRADQVITRALLGAVRDGEIAMPDLVVAKRQDRLAQGRVVVAEPLGLSLVML